MKLPKKTISIKKAMMLIVVLSVGFTAWANVASSRRRAEIRRLELEVEYLYVTRISEIRDNFVTMPKDSGVFLREFERDARAILGTTHPDPDRFLAELLAVLRGAQKAR